MFDELRAIQATFGYLPTDQLHHLSIKLKIPLSQIHAVASFYPHFYLKPPPKVDVARLRRHVLPLAWGRQIRESLDHGFAGQGQDAIIIREVSCLGRCDTAPALSINDHIHSGGNCQQILDLVAAPLKAGRYRACMGAISILNVWQPTLIMAVRAPTRRCVGLWKGATSRLFWTC